LGASSFTASSAWDFGTRPVLVHRPESAFVILSQRAIVELAAIVSGAGQNPEDKP
jgi:hypothetical protein